ncbi:unnamed protein product [Dovyalis caffra]|uniref:non-specific serine/threonine protein kinase n=1 Tax=Dovyalis caffra TaxID=77055 RepID=A0AAV1SKM7_9ROSI|nr:unnamed protein product [Dovyalis caffra]
MSSSQSRLLAIAHLFISGALSTTFTITNNCIYTVWPAILPDISTVNTIGFSLEKNESRIITEPASWSGRIWGRTNCTEDSSGNFSCITGDCGSGKLECSGSPAPPVTMVELSIGGDNGLDYFDISLVNGFNLPLVVVPSAQNCTSSGCFADLNESCPSELQVTSATEGKTVGCTTACQVTGLSMFCCNGTSRTPHKCKPSLYSRFFKDSCPQAYSYSYDDATSMFSCASTNYQVTFCPVKTQNNSLPTSGEITPGPPPEIRPNAASKRRWVPIIAGLVGGVLAIISFVVIIVWRVRGSRSEDTEEDVEDDQIKQVPGMPVVFSYEKLCVATDDFKEILGRGGFGSVFKGVLADGTGIAVKRVEKVGQGKRAFVAEVQTIGSLHHFNLVRLIGFCAEKSHRLLVFEYLSNGSLDKWIFKKSQESSLDWQTRKKIILHIAKGLAYLHEECRQTIMHLDIKPQNILLDPNFNAKISDFGLSKLIDREMSQIQLTMRGTPGYLAPEWHQALGRITVKVDIYSFGIVLLEVICARKCVDHSQPESAFHLLRMLQNKAENIWKYLVEYMQSDREEIIRMIKIAAWCLQDDPESRPPMSTVVKVLEGVMEVDSNLVYRFSHASSPCALSTTFTITNNCIYTVWPAIVPDQSTVNTTGFSLEKNESRILTAPASWVGRIWGRTNCTEDSSGNFSCITGDCGSGKLECSGPGAPPTTLAEFTTGSTNGLDFYDVSLVDGFNLPLLVVPSAQNCTSSGCFADLNESCPSELQVTSATEGKTVGCTTACQVTGLSMFCCNGTSSSPDKCKPSLYSRFFKDSCPQAYSYSYDDATSMFSCASTNYQVTFCPVKTPNNSRPTSGEITPSPPPEIRPNTASKRRWVPIIAGLVGGGLAIVSVVVIIVWRVRGAGLRILRMWKMIK